MESGMASGHLEKQSIMVKQYPISFYLRERTNEIKVNLMETLV